MAMPTTSPQNLPRPAADVLSSAAVRPQGLQIAGGNGVWRKLLMQAEAVAPHLLAAVIEGEQGSGKQTLARCLHVISPFARLPFQRHNARQWLAARTAASTIEGFIYLDRVDLLSAAEQGLLLEVTRSLQDLPRNQACIVASSQASLGRPGTQRAMMSDLLFRLAGVCFFIPPLRARREDIAPLAHFLLDRASKRHRQPQVSLGPGALARLMQHSWPGNVRELAAVLESALLEVGHGAIRAEDLHIPPCDEMRANHIDSGSTVSLDLHTVIRQHVRHVLELNKGNKLRSSRQLGISRSTLYRILGNEAILGR
jgi:DNA-binding NtrC family response regulator